MEDVRLDPYAVATAYIRDFAHCLSWETASLLLGKVRARDYQFLADVSSNLEMHSLDLPAYGVVRQVQAFFKKNADFANPERCRQSAIDSFNRAERICRITNRRLDYYFINEHRQYGYAGLTSDDWNVIDRVTRRLIPYILGDVDSFVHDLPHRLRITTGATALAPRAQSIPFMKFKRTMDCTPRCKPYLEATYRYYGYRKPKVKLINWNRVEFVPKTWKTDRGIACEPTGNLPFQLAFDAYCKRRLKKVLGIDLSDQARNRELAKRGSIDGSYATIDLSMASDTLALNTLAWLLPREWFELLCDFRSPAYHLGESTGRYAKFSSMGNGSTFSLETLVFASIAQEIVPTGDYSVYGDDIVVPTEAYAQLVRILRFFGFVVNSEKSFTSGPFRESCGGDYYQGVDITPFYLRSTAAWDIPNAAHNVNGLAKIGYGGSELWEYLKSFVKDAGLLLTPIADDTQAGVHVHPHHAYGLKLIRQDKRGFLLAKKYTRKSELVLNFDSRSLALWHLLSLKASPSCEIDKFLNKVPGGVKSSGVVNLNGEYSRNARGTQKFVRRWVGWSYPTAGNSDHIFPWSEHLLRES